jgi:DMSO/TMAO reductase YedYZ molybdopterin-dependent catalytic subunit
MLDELPDGLHFVRSHFSAPALALDSWTVELTGAVARERLFRPAELQRLNPQTERVTLECAGHRRSEFNPATPGLQWGVGAVSEASWTGVPLAALLADTEPNARACEVVFEGADHGPHPASSGEIPFARSIPLERARRGDVLLAWAMNGRPIPAEHGGPLRVIVPGYYGVASVKWLRRIELRTSPFTGPFQTHDYLLEGEPLRQMRVSSLIVEPAPDTRIPAGPVTFSGIAWSGVGGIARVDIRRLGTPWQEATLAPPDHPAGLTRWSSQIELTPGPHTIEARAHDQNGNAQPEQPQWNTHGYANNSIHRIPITALAHGT